ncbi:hypothetical protein NCCP1664_08590 [Zafaria cholistanensis]|uniref:D-alanyl-D-alanine carboxypeptidase-like core domain-containing protein n=1 Tax=Zafaria cholistanensis TaxID=1682741 RepID=A0A5A7NQF8_9MICC|nr:M15 family metallopeptidase [Zafaria cholistanensis]GER22362.1 hypothetical protein NCCP1664_08590 [Zafaria cholistanensis]
MYRTRAALALAALLAAALLPVPAAVAGPVDDAAGTPAQESSLVADPSLVVLVNALHPLEPLDYEPARLADAGSGHRMVPEAAASLRRLLAAAAGAGHALRIESAYRSYAQQEALYAGYTRRYGAAYAAQISARPGTSEHQTGLAADIGLASGECSLLACFGDTAAGQWVAAHAAEYGFVVRYPEGLEQVTGFRYEPWHLRFLGAGPAQEMAALGDETLEAYTERLERRAAAAARPRHVLRPAPEHPPWYPATFPRWALGLPA